MSLRKADGSVVEFPCKGSVVQRPSHDQASLVAIQLDQLMQLQSMSQKIDELNAEIRRRRQVEEQLQERSAKLEQDITERMLAEEALRQSEQKFRTLAEALPDRWDYTTGWFEHLLQSTMGGFHMVNAGRKRRPWFGASQSILMTSREYGMPGNTRYKPMAITRLNAGCAGQMVFTAGG
jgi:PAS domain-containing protein